MILLLNMIHFLSFVSKVTPYSGYSFLTHILGVTFCCGEGDFASPYIQKILKFFNHSVSSLIVAFVTRVCFLFVTNASSILLIMITEPTGETHHIKSHITCETFNVIYLIQCRLCSLQYIGETNRRLKDRFNEHRLPILNPTGNYILQFQNTL